MTVSSKSSTTSQQLFDSTERYDILTPPSILDAPEKLLEFQKNKDISHIYPLETHRELANDPNNWFPEDIAENRARNQVGDIATKSEIFDVFIDNEMDLIDKAYNDDGIIDVYTDD